jgi:hypothetical protein
MGSLANKFVGATLVVPAAKAVTTNQNQKLMMLGPYAAELGER